MRCPWIRGLTLCAALMALWPENATAHMFAPVVFSLEETAPGQVTAGWKRPLSTPRGRAPTPVFPDHCEATGPALAERVGTALLERRQLRCSQPLAGSTVAVDGLQQAEADVVLRIRLADGREMQTLLDQDRPRHTIAASETGASVFRGYLGLGFVHILAGLDHLAFVLSLLMLIRGLGQLVATLTAFTLGHSLTLSLSALGLVRAPTLAIEALIALSIVLLAADAVRLARGQPVRLSQRPWSIAAGFGLLHGMGFAGALSEIGLPATQVPLSLLAFNLGIELGQLLFVITLMLCLGWLASRLRKRWPQSPVAAAYLLGAAGAYWFWERLMQMA